MRENRHDWRADIHARLASARLHPQDEAELVEEIGQHLEEQFADLAPKVGARAAREQLLAQLRGPELDDAIARRRRRARPTQARTWSSTSVWHDVRYGCRSLRRSPGLVIAGTTALALGIGLTTIMYSIIYGLLIIGLPYEHADRIAMVQHGGQSREEDDRVPFGSFVHYQRQQRSMDAFGAYTFGTANISGGDRPDRVDVARMTAGAFEVTSVRALIGRTFLPGDTDPSATPTAVLSYALWRDQYRADSGVVGKTRRVNDRLHTIIGVMPDGYQFPEAVKLWLPLQNNPRVLRAWEGQWLTVVGRLRPGVTYAQANSELATLSHPLSVDRPADVPDWRASVRPYVRARMPGRVYSLFYAMLAAVLLVLLVACANVANLLLDRAANRARETGIRTALGASRLAVIRQSLVESAILALMAAVVGTAIAHVGIVLFNAVMIDLERPFWMDIQLHPPVLAFVLVVALLASVISGLLPAIQSARLDISAILKDESHAASSLRIGRMSRAIVSVEIALSTALILAAGMMTKSIIQLRTLDPGVETRGVFTARVAFASPDSIKRRQFFEAAERELAALPGIAGAYLGSGFPGTDWEGDQLAIEGRTYAREEDYADVRTLAVTPGFFSTFDVRVLRGRAIAPTDRAGTTRVAVVSESLARRYFADTDPLGHRIRLGGPTSEEEWLTIVGVLPTLFNASFDMQQLWPAEVFTAFWQAPAARGASIAVRGPADVASAASIRRIVKALDPEIPVFATAAMGDVLAEPLWAVRVFGTMFVIFGVASLVLAAIGLYAVMAFSVSRRAREMGIRMALGASGGDVIRLVCRQGARQIAVGLVVGFVAGAAIVRLARRVLFDVQPSDPTVFTVVALVLGASAFVACIVPAVRATRVDPLVALRTD